MTDNSGLKDSLQSLDKSTVKLEEPQLEQSVVEAYLRIASQTEKMRFEVDYEHQEIKASTFAKVSTFTVLPRIAASLMPHWLIELHFPDHEMPPLGIEVADNIVIGVARYGKRKPDLDLSAYGANKKGVSRTHILLTPGHETLGLIDLGSTNGTWINGNRIISRTRFPLERSNTISLGMLTFLLRIASTPAELGLND